MNKNIHIDKPLVKLIQSNIRNLSIGDYMTWDKLTSDEQAAINKEYDQFILDIKGRSAVNYVLIKTPSLVNDLKEVKTEFDKFPNDTPDTNNPEEVARALEDKIEVFNWHAQRQINIYFRYGCELVYFLINDNKQVQPMVKKEGDDNLIVSPDEGEITLSEYFKSFKKGEAQVDETKDGQKEIFANTMAYNFLNGKEEFLERFSLKENKYAVSSEELYFSFYIAWINNNKEMLLKETLSLNNSSKNLIEIGKAFLKAIIFMRPMPMPNPVNMPNYDFIVYILFKLFKKALPGEESIDITYFDILRKVYQRNPHTFPSFDISNDGHQNKGVLRKIKEEFDQFYKENKFYKYFSYYELDKMKSIYEKIKGILKTADKSTNTFEGDEYDIVVHFNNKSIENVTAPRLPKFLRDACELDIVRNQLKAEKDNKQKTSYEKYKKFLCRMWVKVNETSTENDEKDDILKVKELEGSYTPKYKIILDDVKEENDTLYLFFETVFHGDTKYLTKIEKYLYINPEGFRDDLYGYSKLGIENSRIQNDYMDTHPSGSDSGKIRTDFNEKIRKKILEPLFAEKIFLYGPEKLKKIFADIFDKPNEEGFLIYITKIINTSYEAFRNTMRNLSVKSGKSKINSKLRLKYQNSLFMDEQGLPPFINELELREEINAFFDKKASESGDWLKLSKTCLLSLEYKKGCKWVDQIFEKYKSFTQENTKKVYNERILCFITEYINNEVLTWKK